MFSQALCAAEQRMGEAAIATADEVPVVFRQHNPVAQGLHVSFRDADSGFCLPLTRSMDAQLKALNPNVPSQVMPPLINGNRFEYTERTRKEVKQSVRQNLDLEEQDDSVIIYQPTRVSDDKGLEYSLALAIRLERQLGRRCILLIAGGNEPFAAAQTLKRSLQQTAESQNFEGLRFMNGSHAHEGKRRTSDIMLASDIVALPSTRETFGLGVAEAALSHAPIVAKRYRDDSGNDIFDEVYGDFDVVVDRIDATIPSDEVVLELANVVEDRSRRTAMTERNHELALRYTFTNSTHGLLLDALRRAH
ncbi:glycosyltransferase [Microbacteriaceae bacterium]|nr:glycosyltransferase [Candidatus Saccharibacteria bacterium]